MCVCVCVCVCVIVNQFYACSIDVHVLEEREKHSIWDLNPGLLNYSRMLLPTCRNMHMYMLMHTYTHVGALS